MAVLEVQCGAVQSVYLTRTTAVYSLPTTTCQQTHVNVNIFCRIIIYDALLYSTARRLCTATPSTLHYSVNDPLCRPPANAPIRANASSRRRPFPKTPSVPLSNLFMKAIRRILLVSSSLYHLKVQLPNECRIVIECPFTPSSRIVIDGSSLGL